MNPHIMIYTSNRNLNKVIEMKKKTVKMKRALAKSLEDAIRKSIELLMVALILDASLKLVYVVVPVAAIASMFAKFVKMHIFG